MMQYIMTWLFKPLVRFHKKYELTPEQADQLAKIKFPCC